MIQTAIYDAMKGSYATSPATASSGTQQNDEIGTLAIDPELAGQPDGLRFEGDAAAHRLERP